MCPPENGWYVNAVGLWRSKGRREEEGIEEKGMEDEEGDFDRSSVLAQVNF